MTETVEGVRDPMKTDPDADNVVVRSSMLSEGFDDIVCDVDDEGMLRWPEGHTKAGDPVPWASYTPIETDVDPETWGEHYHHPRDCPETGDSLHRTCEDCTVGVDRE